MSRVFAFHNRIGLQPELITSHDLQHFMSHNARHNGQIPTGNCEYKKYPWHVSLYSLYLCFIHLSGVLEISENYSG